MKSGAGEVRMSLEMAYWSAIQLELVVERTGAGVVMTACKDLTEHIEAQSEHLEMQITQECGYRVKEQSYEHKLG